MLIVSNSKFGGNKTLRTPKRTAKQSITCAQCSFVATQIDRRREWASEQACARAISLCYPFAIPWNLLLFAVQFLLHSHRTRCPVSVALALTHYYCIAELLDCIHWQNVHRHTSRMLRQANEKKKTRSELKRTSYVIVRLGSGGQNILLWNVLHLNRQ